MKKMKKLKVDMVSLYVSKYIVQNTTNNVQHKARIFIDYLPLRINFFGY
jgi:hypothetical protein